MIVFCTVSSILPLTPLLSLFQCVTIQGFNNIALTLIIGVTGKPKVSPYDDSLFCT